MSTETAGKRNALEVTQRSNDYRTPYLTLDLDRVRANMNAIRTSFADLRPQVYYAVKANGHPRLLSLLRDMGCGFDVASITEVNWLLDLGVSPSRLTFSATVKVPHHIEKAFERGVRRFALDSVSEVTKLARLAPGSQVVVRLEVPHSGSRWPLAGKFGVPPREAVDLLRLANSSGLWPYGITFHVGSQCLRPQSWLEALTLCAQARNLAHSEGIDLKLINLGGGLPAQYAEAIPSITEIGQLVSAGAKEAFGPGVEFAIEPGRSVVAEAGRITTSVIGSAERHGRQWVYVDLSIYAGLLEVTGGWTYPIISNKDHLPKRATILAGPTCDSTDIIARDIALPELSVGDSITLLSAGAYTSCYKEYNGFAFPQVHVADSNWRSNPGD